MDLAIQEARETQKLRQLTCLITKRNLVASLIEALNKTKDLVILSCEHADIKTTYLFVEKIGWFAKSAFELELSIQECTDELETNEGLLVYIQPSNQDEIDVKKNSPWDYGNSPGVEGYPAVPPASPFR